MTHNLGEALQLAHRVVVLSRRPGRVRTEIAVGVPQGQRQDAAGRARLAALHEQLWQLIRAEALQAEREMVEAQP